ncbi:MAG: ATP-dependent DNA helicase RecG [Candidatus Omnitrophica bacterium]|nr:ATP-dependent DNA helicase RecG [Candidatus Omnitrophota bacterium]
MKLIQKPLRYIKGIGPKKEELLKKIGIYNIKDLLYYFPFRYEDRRNFKKIKELVDGEFCVIKGKVLARNFRKIPYFVKNTHIRSIFNILFEDESGIIDCVWFNQPYLVDIIKVGDNLIIYGKVTKTGNKLQLVCPEYEKSDNDENFLNLGRIVGIYKLTSSLTQKFLRKLIFNTLENAKKELIDPLPFDIRKEKNFPNVIKSLEQMHFPSSLKEAQIARERFIFEELFFAQVLVYLRKANRRMQKTVSIKVEPRVLEKVKNNLGFSLTSSQSKAIFEIINDLSKPFPMHRLLQGEVGCGKTVVVSFAIAATCFCGFQVAFMVPTEILAYQHKDTLERILKGFGFKIEVLVSSFGTRKIKQIKKDLEDGKIDIIIGTHALIQEEVKFKNLALVIIDEQHKFGVAQRALLPKKGINPHCLIMSATPIPRSLALSLYGDLELSVIRELPFGRIKPKTILYSENDREKVYEFLESKLKENRQVYIIYPVIEETEEQDLKSLEAMHEKIKNRFFKFTVGKLYSSLPQEEKINTIKEFIENKINILVSTTVVEVGMNIENATVMVVENPERFGLAQLHQLRGRIQRSNHQPYFILIGKEDYPMNAKKRLEIITKIDDGFKIAEEDLILRGPGDLFGLSQHGFPDLNIANPIRDLEILKEARLYAYRVIKSDPYLNLPQHKCIAEYLNFWFKKSTK